MAFTGFPKAGVAFFQKLAALQDRDWFQAHKAEFKQLWEQPMQALLDEVTPSIARQYRGKKLGKPKVFRIHRDVRFSKDKSPFKTHLGAVLMAGAGPESGDPAALYVHLGLEEASGAGHWFFLPPQLAAFRRLVADEKKGAELGRRVAALEKKGFTFEAFEGLKRVPPGFDPDHPRARLLKMKGLGINFPRIPGQVRFSPALAKWLVAQSATAAPLVLWLDAQL